MERQLQSRFFTVIPAELRLQIYHRVLDPPDTAHGPVEKLIWQAGIGRVRDGLLSVCKRIRDEASSIAWRDIILRYPIYSLDSPRAQCPPATLAPYISRLEIDVSGIALDQLSRVVLDKLDELANFISQSGKLRQAHLRLSNVILLFSPRALERRLAALARAKLPADVELTISIGKGRHPLATQDLVAKLQKRIKAS